MTASSEPPGWLLRGDPGSLEALRPELEEAARRGEKRQGFRALGATRVFLKYGPLRGRARLRHALRRAFSRAQFPRIQEFENLDWLRARGFDAPRPLAAGVELSWGMPRFQFLATTEIPGARTLGEYVLGSSAERRALVIARLASELARMHALGFVHRDLFTRNLLVVEERGTPRIFFVDAWRGGPRERTPFGRRDAAFDLACLMLEGATLFDAREQELFLHSYLAGGEAPGERNAGTLFLRVARLRRGILARESRRRPEPFARYWNPPF
jgi:hypothetical protein